jgi:hypothetical protein
MIQSITLAKADDGKFYSKIRSITSIIRRYFIDCPSATDKFLKEER